MTPQEHYARLVAVQFTAPPFAGRAKLLAMASKINSSNKETRELAESALRALEMTPREREIAAIRGQLHYRVLRAFGLNVAPAVVAARRIRAQREHKQFHIRIRPDPIAERAPGEALKRLTFDKFDTARRRAHFRHARHGNEQDVVFVPIGQEDVKVEVNYVPPQQAGLSRKYRYWVAQVRFVWHVSSAILRVPEDQRAKRGFLYLAPNVRVRQGRGFNLVVERA